MKIISDNIHNSEKRKYLDSYVSQLQSFYKEDPVPTDDDIMNELMGTVISDDEKKFLSFFGSNLASDNYVRLYIPSLSKKKEQLSAKLDFLRLKHICKNLDSNILEMDRENGPLSMRSNGFLSNREVYNQDVYCGLNKLMREYFYKSYIDGSPFSDEYFIYNRINNDDIGVLAISFALTYVNIYFELIYSDIEDFFKFCKMEKLSPDELEKKINSFSNFLIDKYGGNNVFVKENISGVLGKYFIDTRMVKEPINGLPRTIMKKLRTYFPSVSERNLKKIRNLSHGDFEVIKEDGKYVIVKTGENGFSLFADELFDVVKNTSFDENANDDIDFAKNFKKGCFAHQDAEFLDFLRNNVDPEKKLQTCGLEDSRVLQMLVQLSYYSIIQYNLQHYFKDNERFNSDDFDLLNFNDLFELEQDGGTFYYNSALSGESLIYKKYEYLKNAMGHGNIHVSEKGLSAHNPRSYVSVFNSLLDSIEFFSQPEFLSLVVLPKVMHDAYYSNFLYTGKSTISDATAEYKTDCSEAVMEAIFVEKENAFENKDVSSTSKNV